MRIGINGLSWFPSKQAGVDTYLRQLIQALQEIDSSNEYVVFVSRDAQYCLELGAKNFREVVCPTYGQWPSLRVLWEQAVLARRAEAEGIEAMLCVGGLVPHNLRVPSVQVIHDLQVFHYSENFSWAKREFLKRMLPRSARAAALTIASSAYTCEDVIKLLGQRREKTRVVLLAAGEQFRPASAEAIAQVKRQYNMEDEYVLCVATSHRHKKVAALVDVYDEVAGETRAGGLVLVGRAGSGSAQVLAALRHARRPERICLLGHVNEKTLPALYSGASAFIMPSLFEGFGMTMLEAMQCGCPVACSNLTAAPEATGDAALLFDPRDRKQFAAAFKRIICDDELRQSLRKKGFAQARRFSWLDTAQKTLAVIQEATRIRTTLSIPR